MLRIKDMESKKLFVFITLWFILSCELLSRTSSDAFEGPKRRNYRRRRRLDQRRRFERRERRDDAFVSSVLRKNFHGVSNLVLFCFKLEITISILYHS